MKKIIGLLVVMHGAYSSLSAEQNPAKVIGIMLKEILANGIAISACQHDKQLALEYAKNLSIGVGNMIEAAFEEDEQSTTTLATKRYRGSRDIIQPILDYINSEDGQNEITALVESAHAIQAPVTSATVAESNLEADLIVGVGNVALGLVEDVSNAHATTTATTKTVNTTSPAPSAHVPTA